MDEIIIHPLRVLSRYFVWVVESRQPSESGFYVTLGGSKREREVGVECAGGAQVMVGFVDGIEKVEGYDGNVDEAAMFGIPGTAWSGLGGAGANGQGVVYCLDPACHELGGRLVPVWGLGIRDEKGAYVGKEGPAY
jgi:hypothetical protein